MTLDNNPEIKAPEKDGLKRGNAQEQSVFSKSTIVAIIGIAVVIVILLAAGFTQNMPGQGTVIPPSTCAEKTLTFVNNNLVSPGTSASLTSITENRGIYEMQISYGGRDMTIFTTRDCSSLFTSRIDMTGTMGSRTVTAQPAAPPIKTE